MDVEIFNYQLVSSDYDFRGVDSDLFVSAIEKTFLDFKNDLNIVFVDSIEIRRLNLEFRKKDSVTDVLSFKSAEGMDKDEIYLCPSFILNSIKSNTCTASFVSGRLFLIEIFRMVSHGILHINDFDHSGYFDGGFDVKVLTNELKITEPMFIEQEKRLKVLLDNLKVI